MKVLQLLPIGELEDGLLRTLAPAIADTFGVPCELVAKPLDPTFAYHRERQQYHSSEILQAMRDRLQPDSWKILGVAEVDLYIPILTFVFGEAQMGGPCALISAHRLRQEFYGLPTDPATLYQRLLKEAVHEIGHTLELTHCEDYQCAMAPSHAVEWIDLKEKVLCSACRSRVFVP
jgi:archaemetzincin